MSTPPTGPGVPDVGAVLGTKHGSAIARTLRTGWWPRFLVAGVVLAVGGVTLLSGTAQTIVVLVGALTFVFAATQGLFGKSWDEDRMREPRLPPGSGGGVGGL